MAERYEDFDRNRDRERERERDAGQPFDDYRRQSRGEEFGQSGRDYRRDRDYDRERGSGGREGYGTEPRYRGGRGTQASEFDREGREDLRWREGSGYAGQGWGGGMGAYSGQDWRTRQGYGGGIEGTGRGERAYSERGGYQGGAYGQGAYGQESYGEGRYGAESWRGSAGRFTGRGPKGYRRSDERIREDVCERLTQHPEIDASEIEVQVSNGEVTLTGSVDDRHQKRTTEDIVENLSGVREVHNQIRISTGLGHRMGEALGLTGGREEDRTRGTTTTSGPSTGTTTTTGTTSGRQNEPPTTRR